MKEKIRFVFGALSQASFADIAVLLALFVGVMALGGIGAGYWK